MVRPLEPESLRAMPAQLRAPPPLAVEAAAATRLFHGPAAFAPRAHKPLAAREWPVFHRVLAGLRALVPPAFPVVVRIGKLDRGTAGTCCRTRSRFVIKLAGDLGEEAALDVLLHEFAHATSWNHALDKLAADPEATPAEFDAASHDSAWGCSYAQIWRAFVAMIAARRDEEPDEDRGD